MQTCLLTFNYIGRGRWPLWKNSQTKKRKQNRALRIQQKGKYKIKKKARK